MTAKATIAALRRSHEELTATVKGFDDNALKAQSGAAEWTVAQVLSHLGSGAELMLLTVQAALDGEPAPDRDTTAPAIWDRWNGMSPPDQAANFIDYDSRTIGRFESIDDDTLASLQIDVGFLPMPIDVDTVASLRLSEHALHSWDVNVATESGAVLPDYALPPYCGCFR